MKIKCVVVDDEPLAVEKLTGYISRVPFLELQASFTCGMDVLQYLKENKTDLLFLDIQMDDITGIQLLEVLQHKPYVVLTTAYSEYAIKGFDLDVADYLLKPIFFERFLQSVNRIHDKILHNENSLSTNKVEMQVDFMFVKTEYRIEKVMFDEIHFIEGMKDYLRINCNDRQIMVLTNFKNMQEIIPQNVFFRVHKSFIINLSKIMSIEKSHVIVLNERIPIGDNFRKSFLELVEKLKLINTK